jgi:hypothetical protein
MTNARMTSRIFGSAGTGELMAGSDGPTPHLGTDVEGWGVRLSAWSAMRGLDDRRDTHGRSEAYQRRLRVPYANRHSHIRTLTMGKDVFAQLTGLN